MNASTLLNAQLISTLFDTKELLCEQYIIKGCEYNLNRYVYTVYTIFLFVNKDVFLLHLMHLM